MIDERLLDEKLKELSSKFTQYHRPSLTREIKVLFASLFANQEGCYRYANGVNDKTYQLIDADSEFMFDLLVVREERNSDKALQVDFIADTLLALETELDESLSSIVTDFQKLLISNADEKVLVCKCHSSEFDKYHSTLEEHLNKYKKASGKHHIVARLNDTGKFERRVLRIL